MPKIVELNKREEEAVSGGEYNFNCTHSDTWYIDEGPCVDTDSFICLKKPDESSFLSNLGYGTLFFIGVVVTTIAYTIQRTRMMRAMRRPVFSLQNRIKKK